MSRWRSLAAVAASLVLSGVGERARAADEIVWRHRVEADSLMLSANPQTAAQRTAFYLARGFSMQSIEAYARACGFSFAIHNRSRQVLAIRLADWYALGADGRRIRLRLPHEWESHWQRAGVPEAARLAFRWAQLQAESSFDADDWIMGMVTLEQPVAGVFRLVAGYKDANGYHEITLDQLACSHD